MIRIDKEVVAKICKNLSPKDVKEWLWVSSILSGVFFLVSVSIAMVPIWNESLMTVGDWTSVVLASATSFMMALRMLDIWRHHWAARKEFEARHIRMQAWVQIFTGWRRRDPTKIPVITGGKVG